MKETSPIGFRRLLIERRYALCMTQKEFAEKLKMPLATYKNYECSAGENYRKKGSRSNKMSPKTARKFIKEFPDLNFTAIQHMILQDKYFNIKVKQKKEGATPRKDGKPYQYSKRN